MTTILNIFFVESILVTDLCTKSKRRAALRPIARTARISAKRNMFKPAVSVAAKMVKID